jgi:hypothetical protein
MALTTRMCRSWTSRMMWVPGVGSADADVVESAVVTDGHGSGFVDAVVADPVVGVGVAGLAGHGFGHGVVEGRGCRTVGQ